MVKKNTLITALIIVAVILFVIYIQTRPSQETPEAIAKCIGENSIVYVQLGCHACGTQEDLFGENYRYITEIDCFFEGSKCQGIAATPTWEINGEFYEGVQSIEKLQELTEC